MGDCDLYTWRRVEEYRQDYLPHLQFRWHRFLSDTRTNSRRLLVPVVLYVAATTQHSITNLSSWNPCSGRSDRSSVGASLARRIFAILPRKPGWGRGQRNADALRCIKDKKEPTGLNLSWIPVLRYCNLQYIICPSFTHKITQFTYCTRAQNTTIMGYKHAL